MYRPFPLQQFRLPQVRGATCGARATRKQQARRIHPQRRWAADTIVAVPLNSGYTPSGAAKIYYEEVGTGRPVLFCHAGVTDRRMWDPQFDNPVLGHRYIRSDMRGFGNSEWVAEAYRSHADILAVIEHLDLDDVVLVGCSMGGKAAMEVTVAAPERISGLVVIGAGEPG